MARLMARSYRGRPPWTTGTPRTAAPPSPPISPARCPRIKRRPAPAPSRSAHYAARACSPGYALPKEYRRLRSAKPPLAALGISYNTGPPKSLTRSEYPLYFLRSNPDRNLRGTVATAGQDPRWWWLILCPELKQFPANERRSALDTAKGEALEVFELIGILIAIGLVTWITRKISAGVSVGGGFIVGLLSFVLAIPLLALSAGPFLVRRMRRGLRKRLHEH